MSYMPKSERATVAIRDLKVPAPKDAPWYAKLSPMYPAIDVEALREVLIATVCPIVCEGVIRGEKWHELCEAKADAAMKALTND
jgi:hypothetical protein